MILIKNKMQKMSRENKR